MEDDDTTVPAATSVTLSVGPRCGSANRRRNDAMIDDDVTLDEIDEAIGHVRAALVSAIDGKDSRAETNLRRRIDELLEARMILTRDLPAVMSCVPVFSG